MQKYKVSYWAIFETGIVKAVTEVDYETKEEAQKYANQLNDGVRFKYARARKA